MSDDYGPPEAIPMPHEQDTPTLQQQAREGDEYSKFELKRRGETW